MNVLLDMHEDMWVFGFLIQFCDRYDLQEISTYCTQVCRHERTG